MKSIFFPLFLFPSISQPCSVATLVLLFADRNNLVHYFHLIPSFFFSLFFLLSIWFYPSVKPFVTFPSRGLKSNRPLSMSYILKRTDCWLSTTIWAKNRVQKRTRISFKLPTKPQNTFSINFCSSNNQFSYIALITVF